MSELQNAIGWRMATAVVWAAVAVSGWYWAQAAVAAGISISTDAPRVMVMPDISSPVVLARLLGATSPAEAVPGPGLADRFALSGVIASSAGQGVALIAVDGKPARPFTVGSELVQGYVLVAVASREALLADGLNAPVRVVLTLPLQQSTKASSELPGDASAASSTSSNTAVPNAPVPSSTEHVSPVPARADARRQPQTSLRREDHRTP